MTTLTASNFKGTFTAIVTPFNELGDGVDYESLESVIEHQIKSGVQGLVVCGSTGEAATLSDDEYRTVVTFTQQRIRGRIPLVGGVGASSTKRATALALFLQEAKLDAVMVVAPPYNKPPQAGIIQHFEEIKRAIKSPLIAYNVPGRTGVNILPKTLHTLTEKGVIIGVKEACGSAEQILDLMALVHGKLSVVSGDDSLINMVIASGGMGVISVLSNVAPKLVVALTDAALKGEIETSAKLQLKALPLVRALFSEANPIPVKAALKLQGQIKHSTLRLPLIDAEEATLERLSSLLKDIA